MYYTKLYFFKPEPKVFYPIFTTREEAHDFRIAMNRLLPRYGKAEKYPYELDNDVYEFIVERKEYDNCPKI